MGKKNLRRVSVLVTAQTLKNLQRLANMSGYNAAGPGDRQAHQGKDAVAESGRYHCWTVNDILHYGTRGAGRRSEFGKEYWP